MSEDNLLSGPFAWLYGPREGCDRYVLVDGRSGSIVREFDTWAEAVDGRDDYAGSLTLARGESVHLPILMEWRGAEGAVVRAMDLRTIARS